MILISILLHETATTAIYTYCHTLSLHDALPISFLPRWDGIDQDGAEIIHIGSRRPGDKQRVEPREKAITVIVGKRRRRIDTALCGRGERAGPDERDRKSVG